MKYLQEKKWAYPISFLILISFLLFQVNAFVKYKYGSEPGAALREVESLESLDLLWSFNLKIDGPLAGSCDERRYWLYTQLDAEHNQLILPIWDGKIPLIPRVYLSGLDLETGQTNWSTWINKSYSSYSINGNSTRIIVVERGPEPSLGSCSPDLYYCESARILAYDIETGEEVWSRLQSNMYNADTLCVGEEIVSIEGISTRSTHQEKFSLDAMTGDKIPFQDLYPNATNSDLESSRHIARIIEEMGIDGFGSDYVNQGKYLYLLTRYNKTLWVLNRETSEIVGKAEFTGESLVGNRSDFTVLADNNYVVVYLGDSQQVFAFRFLLNSPDS